MSNARAARRRAEKAAKNAGVPPKRDVQIQLANPESHNFEAFIAGNATVCRNVHFHDDDVACTEACTPMAEGDSAKGKHLVLCGAGPSLKEHIDEWAPKADQIWGCNSAAAWLYANGYPVTHGFCIDQTQATVTEWADAPPIEYLMATTCHPDLVQHLVAKSRATRFFHNFVGLKKPPVEVEPGAYMEYENWLYITLYPGTVRCGSGLNSVTRAMDLAQFMGFEKVTVLGADCAIRFRGELPDTFFGPNRGVPQIPATASEAEKDAYDAACKAHNEAYIEWLRTHTEMHVDGGNALASGATPICFGDYDRKIDGRHQWLTKPDMAISAQWLMRMAKTSNGRVQMVGDTLPNAMLNKGEQFLGRLPVLTDSNGDAILPEVPA